MMITARVNSTAETVDNNYCEKELDDGNKGMFMEEVVLKI